MKVTYLYLHKLSLRNLNYLNDRGSVIIFEYIILLFKQKCYYICMFYQHMPRQEGVYCSVDRCLLRSYTEIMNKAEMITELHPLIP